KEGYESFVRFFERAQGSLGQGVEPLVEVQDEVGGLRRFPSMARRDRQGGRRGQKQGEGQEERGLTNDHGRRTGARLTDSVARAEHNASAPPPGGLRLASAIGCAPWEGV